ncbi:MAG: polysaccharide biosynthesis protein [Alcanivorax sp.]|nr:MAG: polysaccharide biosynthesis protein [Alcanivorax sp.]
MSSWSNLVKGAGVYVSTSIINASIPFFLLPILTRYLSPKEYGEVAIFGVWIALVGALCGLSVHAAANRKYFDLQKDQEEMGKYIFSCLLILIISSLVFLSLTIILSGYLNSWLKLSPLWLILGIPVAVGNFVIQIRLGQWQVREKPATFGIFQISQSLLNVGLSLLLVVIYSLGVTGRITGIAAAILLFAVLALILLFKDDLIRCSWRPDLIKDALKFGVPLVPHILGAFLLLTVDRAVLTSLIGLDAAGIYMVALQIGMVVSLLLDAVNKAFSPWLYKNLSLESYQAKVSVVKVTYTLYGLLFIGAVLGFLVGPTILNFVVGDEFEAATAIVGWVILGQALRGAYLFVTNYIFHTKRTGLVSIVTICTGVLNVGLLFLLVTEFGVAGAAYALCISMLLQWLATWIIASRLVKMPWLLAITKMK